jgi:hypothetical protein
MAVQFPIQCQVRWFSRMFANNSYVSCSDDMYAPESIELLQKSGIDFQRHEEIGILPNDFAELMITSGLVLASETKWISFHRQVSLIASFKRLESAITYHRAFDIVRRSKPFSCFSFP